MKKKFLLVFKFLFTLLGFGFIAFTVKNSCSDIQKVFYGISFFKVFLIIFLCCCSVFFIVLRLKYVFSALKIKMPFWGLCRAIYVGYYFNMFLPTSIGGDVVKVYYAYKLNRKKEESILAVFLDRSVGFITLLVQAIIGVFFISERVNLPYFNEMLSCISLLVLAAIMFFYNERCVKLIHFGKNLGVPEKAIKFFLRLYFIVNKMKGKPLCVLKAVLCSFVLQMLMVFWLFAFAKLLSIPVNYITLFALVPLVGFVSMLPSINGMGVREGMFVFLLSFFVQEGYAVVLALLFGLETYSCNIIGFFVYIFQGVKYKVSEEFRSFEPET